MRWAWGPAIALLLAACSSTSEKSQAQKEAEKQQDPKPAKTQQDVDWKTDTSEYTLADPEILGIPPFWKYSANGKEYTLRYYTEHHPGDEHNIPIVTVGNRMATVMEFWECMALRQKQMEDEGTRQGRILRGYYNVDEIRADDTLDHRIKYKTEAIREVEEIIDRLVRQINAERAIPGNESDKKISFWMAQLVKRENEYRLLRAELAILKHKRWIREQALQPRGGPEVTPKVEPRVTGVESHRIPLPPRPADPAPKVEEKKPEEPKPEEKKAEEPKPEEKKPEEPPAPPKPEEPPK
jgi:hypothetical protein